MKKLLLSLGTLASVVAPVAAVVACGTSADADGAKPTTGTDGTSGTKNTDGAGGATGTLGDKVDESQGEAALLQENKDSDIALVKTSTLTEEEQKAAIAKINAAKSTVELGVAFLDLNLVQKGAPTTQTAEQKAAQKAKEAQFAKNQAALKTKINASKLDRAVQLTLVGQVTAATAQTTLDAIETDFNAKVAESTSIAKVKTDAEATINALKNLNEPSKKAYIVRVHNAQSEQVIKTILTGANFEDKKGPQIKAADYATKETALVIELKDSDEGQKLVLNTKGISGNIFVQIKDVKVSVNKESDGTFFATVPDVASNVFEVTKESFKNFADQIDLVKNYYDDPANALTSTTHTTKATIFDSAKAIEDIKKEINGKIHTYQVNANPVNGEQKTKFLESADKIKTQADLDVLEASVKAFKVLDKPIPAAGTIDYYQKASDEFDALFDAGELKLLATSNLRKELQNIKTKADYDKFVADLNAAKKTVS